MYGKCLLDCPLCDNAGCILLLACIHKWLVYSTSLHNWLIAAAAAAAATAAGLSGHHCAACVPACLLPRLLKLPASPGLLKLLVKPTMLNIPVALGSWQSTACPCVGCATGVVALAVLVACVWDYAHCRCVPTLDSCQPPINSW